MTRDRSVPGLLLRILLLSPALHALPAHADLRAECGIATDDADYFEVSVVGLISSSIEQIDPKTFTSGGKDIAVSENEQGQTKQIALQDLHGLVCIQLGDRRIWTYASSVAVECKLRKRTISAEQDGPGKMGVGSAECERN